MEFPRIESVVDSGSIEIRCLVDYLLYMEVLGDILRG